VARKRTLTSDETRTIIEEVRGREQSAHPDQTIQVFVSRETDDAGQPQIRVLRTGTSEAAERPRETKR
jgi:hypothetical protein